MDFHILLLFMMIILRDSDAHYTLIECKSFIILV